MSDKTLTSSFFSNFWKKISHLFCALAFASNVWYTETEPFQPHKLPQFLALEGLKTGVPALCSAPPAHEHSGAKLSTMTQLLKEPLYPSHAVMGHQCPQSTVPSQAPCSYPMKKKKKRWQMPGWVWALAQGEMRVSQQKCVSIGDFIFWADRPHHF